MTMGTPMMGRPSSGEPMEVRQTDDQNRSSPQLRQRQKKKNDTIRNPYAKQVTSPKQKTRAKKKRHIQQNIQFKKRPQATQSNGRQWQENEKDKIVKQNSFWGHSSTIPHDKLFRAYFINIHGIKSRQDFEDAAELLHNAAGNKIQITGFAETNVPWHDKRVVKKIRTHMRRVWTASKLATSAAPMTGGEKFYQPGGTAMILNGDWTGRVIDCTEDASNMGRWSTMRLQGKEDKKLAFICAYRVCDQDIRSTGSNTVFTQQWNHLRAQGIEEPDPRLQFIIDLTKHMKRLKSTGHQIFLMGDMNEATESEKSAIAKMLVDCDMVNLHRYIHKSLDDPPNTFIRGKECIDLLAGTDKVAENTKHAGIEAFGQTFHSDHRGMFADIDIATILNGHPAELGAMMPRSISGTDPRTILPFQAAVAKYFSQHKMAKRQQNLSRFLEHPPKSESQLAAMNREMQALDRDLTRAFEVGAKKGKQPFKSPYSLKVINQRRIIRYWKLWETEVRTKTDMYDQRSQLFNDIDWHEDTPLLQHAPSICQIKGKVRAAAKDNRTLLINSKSEREKFLTEKASYWALYDNKKTEKILKRIKHAEAAKAMFSHIGQIKGATSVSPVKSVSIPLNPAKPDGPCTTIYDNDQVCQKLLERNEKHFAQSNGTDFTKQHVIQALGRHGEGGQAGLDELDVQELSKATAQLIQKLKQYRLKEINTRLVEEEITSGFKHWREGTSTSPSGRDLSRYKAIFAPTAQKQDHDEEMSEQEQAESTEHIGEKVAEVITLLLNLCAQEGIALDRWLKIYNTMLEKIVGMDRIDKLRVIHIMEADLNLLLGILFGRRLTNNAESNNCLGDLQWGARKGKQCIDVVLLKQLTYEIARMTRTDITTFDNDAKSCYDRIVMSYALHRCQQLGMPVKACKMLGEYLDNARYYIKTQLGVSEGFYQSSKENPLHGAGQGSKLSPPIWTFVSTAGTEILEEVNDGLTVCSPDQNTQATRPIDAFVDDTTTWANQFVKELLTYAKTRFNTETAYLLLNDLVYKTTELAQSWEELLWSTGGKLELPKCFFYIVSWWFDHNGEAKVRTKAELKEQGIKIDIIESETKETAAIKHRDCREAHRTLGPMICPLPLTSEEGQRLKKTADKMACNVRGATMTKHEATVLYNSI
jgi:negative regulator of replication initiation